MNYPEYNFSRSGFIEIPDIEPGEINVRADIEIPLHVCADGCGCELVYPTYWNEISYDEDTEQAVWDVCLRCPECEHIREGEYTDEQVGELDDILNQDRETLLLAEKEVIRTNMQEYVVRFSNALQNDYIEPMDF